MEFTIADVERLGIEIFSTVKIKKHSLFFDPMGFTDLEHYKRMLGYDKPIEIIQEADELKDAYRTLRGKKDTREDVAASKESKAEESVIVEQNTGKAEKVRQRV